MPTNSERNVLCQQRTIESIKRTKELTPLLFSYGGVLLGATRVLTSLRYQQFQQIAPHSYSNYNLYLHTDEPYLHKVNKSD